MEYQHWTIKQAMERIAANKLYLPAIQRKFVWGPTKIERLFDSLMRDYPIGTFLFWMVSEAKKNDYSFYKFFSDFHERDKWKNPLADKPHLPDELIGVLDGQQRLNSMYIALQGTYAYKRRHVRSSSANAYPVRQLYLNVFKPVEEFEDQDCIYEFKFLTADEANIVAKESCWCLVKSVLECDSVSKVNKFWDRERAMIPEEVEVDEETLGRALNMLSELWQRLTHVPVINFFPVNNQSLDEILDIFVRVNSAGTPLGKTDLLFSTIVAHWDGCRDQIETLQEKINAKGEGFQFNIDFIMRTCLVLTECPVRLRVSSFRPENVEAILDNWDEIASSVEAAVDLLVKWGFEGSTVTSANAVIPIAYALYQKCDRRGSEPDLRMLFVKSLITSAFGSHGDQVLTGVRKAISLTLKPGAKFDLKAFEKKLRLPTGSNFTIDGKFLEELLTTEKGPRSFALLSLLSPQMKFSQVHFHQDHIHPYAGFASAKLKKLKLTDEQISEWQQLRDTLPNLQLLEGNENEQKTAMPFGDWLKQEYPTAAERKHFLNGHHIPSNPSFPLHDFENFYEQRKAVLKKKLASLLGAKL